MGRYFAYRLSIESELPLPEMEEAEGSAGPADVVIRLGKVDRTPLGSAQVGAGEDAAAREFLLQYPGAGAFLIRQGREIVVEPDAGAEDASVRAMLTGPALAVLLHQRGYLILHASCVARGACAIAFAADSGTGKSTLAAAFTARGFGLVADDIVAVDTDAPGGPRIFPGYFQMKLSPESARSIGVEWEGLANLGIEKNKRGHRSRGTAMSVSLALRRIYLPADDTCETIDRLSPQESFGQVIHHSYALPILSHTQTQRSHFRQAAKLASAVPVRKLGRRRSLDLLPTVVAMVEQDLAAEGR